MRELAPRSRGKEVGFTQPHVDKYALLIMLSQEAGFKQTLPEINAILSMLSMQVTRILPRNSADQ